MSTWNPTGRGDGSHNAPAATPTASLSAEDQWKALSEEVPSQPIVEDKRMGEEQDGQNTEQEDKDLMALLEHGVPLSKLDELYGKAAVRRVGKHFVEDSEVGRATSKRLEVGQALLARSNTLQKDANFSHQLVQVLREDPPEDLMDPLMMEIMHDPVVISSGFIVDRSSVCCDPSDPYSALRFSRCPFSRVPIESTVFPINMIRAKCSDWKQGRIKKAISLGQGFLSSGDWDMALEAIDAIEKLLEAMDPHTFRHTAKHVSELIEGVPEEKRSVALTSRLHHFNMKSTWTPEEEKVAIEKLMQDVLSKGIEAIDKKDEQTATSWFKVVEDLLPSVLKKKKPMSKRIAEQPLPEWEGEWTLANIRLYRLQDPTANVQSDDVYRTLKATNNVTVKAVADANPDWAAQIEAFLEERQSDSGHICNIPLDRCVDIQWNPPGYPTLRAGYWGHVYGDRGKPLPGEGFYSVFENQESGETEFIRVVNKSEEEIRSAPSRQMVSRDSRIRDGAIVVFRSMNWTSTNGTMMMFCGEGMYGTLILGPDEDATSGRADYENTYRPTHDEAMAWLRENYGAGRRVN
mmetsp:Transcript_36058/g.43488  ORF Transcript_36058/g.43488 Transcript_36058/m.43488 type:complete len:575 (+) Transcript_36058:154-1878(+)